MEHRAFLKCFLSGTGYELHIYVEAELFDFVWDVGKIPDLCGGT